MSSKNNEAVYIERELYSRLRTYCDNESIRFRDFVENALEEAVESDRITKVLESEIDKLKRKAVKYDYAFKRGFEKGFLFFYSMATGLNAFDRQDESLEIMRKFPPEAPKGKQMKLF